MTHAKKSLIIIPGLGDRVGLYRLATPIWKLLGYRVHIFSFGWENISEDFSVTMKRLVEYIDSFHGTQVDVIGVSAGGTAAINTLLLRPHIVNRIVTVATPYKYYSHLENTKLKASINYMERIYFNSLRSRILSMYGLHDRTAPSSASRPKGIHARRVYMINHGCIIATTLTLYSIIIRRFLKDGLQ